MTDNLSKSIKSTTYELSWANRGLKGNNAADVKELCDEIKQCKVLKALRLEGNTINEEAATAIGKALEKHSEIERLIWNDLFTTRLKTEVPPSLVKLTQGLLINGAHIVEINLSDNAFGPIGVKGLERFLSSSACFTLEELRLNNCGMGSMGGKMLADALMACHKNSIAAGGRKFALKQFIAGRNRLENEGAQALAKAFETIGTLEVIRVPQNGIRAPGIEALSNAFVQNRNLRIIDLNDNTITTAAGQLASTIEKLPRLEILNLESSLIRTKGAIAIARSIVSHRNLQELYLGCNDMHVEGGLEVARAVKNMPSLKVLDLNGNCFGLDGIDEIRQALENKSFLDQMAFSDDEGSDEDEEEEEEGEDDEQEEDDDHNESDENTLPSHVPNGKSAAPASNGFQFGFANVQKAEPVAGLSTMMAKFDFTTSSPFNFGQQTNKENKWTSFHNIDHVKQQLKNDEQSIDRAMKLLDELFNELTLSNVDSSNIGKNILTALTLNKTNERHFNNQLLVCLGFVKDEQLGRQRRTLKGGDQIYQTLIDLQPLLPKSTKNLLLIFLQNSPIETKNGVGELKQKLINTFQR